MIFFELTPASVNVIVFELTGDANLTDVNAISGHLLLRKAAEEAAIASQFEPVRPGKEIVQAVGIVVYNFNNQLDPPKT